MELIKGRSRGGGVVETRRSAVVGGPHGCGICLGLPRRPGSGSHCCSARQREAAIGLVRFELVDGLHVLWLSLRGVTRAFW